jgi:hypothetical protein
MSITHKTGGWQFYGRLLSASKPGKERLQFEQIAAAEVTVGLHIA